MPGRVQFRFDFGNGGRCSVQYTQHGARLVVFQQRHRLRIAYELVAVFGQSDNDWVGVLEPGAYHLENPAGTVVIVTFQAERDVHVHQ